MLSELKTAKEIAVDLEHHDTHSYIGLVSLMQISTRDKDWVVDTLKPWRDQLQVLNEVFADPTILKVRGSLCRLEMRADQETGFPWRLHGHDVATKGSWALRRRFIRHLSCVESFGLPQKEPGIASGQICQLQGRQELSNCGLADTV